MPPMVVPLAHDFSCPWCWIGLFQAQRLAAEFNVRFEWIGYELYPEGTPYDEAKPREHPANRPPTPGRLELAYAAQGMRRPQNRGPVDIRTHKAHEAVEFARQFGPVDSLIEAIYRAYFEQAADIDDIQVIAGVARPFVADLDEMLRSIAERRFQDRIVPFDHDAYESGVYNVPTFFIGGERYAEQPYVVLKEALEETGVPA